MEFSLLSQIRRELRSYADWGDTNPGDVFTVKRNDITVATLDFEGRDLP